MPQLKKSLKNNIDKYNNQLNQQYDSYYKYIPLGSKDDKYAGVQIIDNYSSGLKLVESTH